ncbi:MAG: hypothetical protein IJO61_03375 [Oscillospiraceae bacterium]|nr:hypothetical protein [Oscillospiraceae bacterium]
MIKKFFALVKKFNTFTNDIGLSRRYWCKFTYAFKGLVDWIVFGSTITDFFELRFYEKSFSEKKRYMTWRYHKKAIYLFDDFDSLEKYRDKNNMYSALRNCVSRDMLQSSQCSFGEFEEFVSRHPVFLYKPNNTSCGIGIRKIKASECDLPELFEDLKKQAATLDEIIEQHSYLRNICNQSVNTIRIVTLKKGNDVQFIGAAFRAGIGNSVVDNYAAGGLVASIDLETGQLIDRAENMYGERFDKHPVSNISFKGFQLPNWEKVLSSTKQWALNFEINYVAWDIAIRENDCVLVEANPTGMVNVIQIAGAGGRREQYNDLIQSWKQK